MSLVGLTFFSLASFLEKLSQGISVSPHTTYSKMVSWRKMYCSCALYQRVYIHSTNGIGLAMHYPVYKLHTSVWTICILCSLSLLTMPGMSTTPSALACSRARSMAMKVPVRPTPALQCTRIGGDPFLHADITFFRSITRGVPYLGTPWSGQEVKWYWVKVKLFSPT